MNFSFPSNQRIFKEPLHAKQTGECGFSLIELMLAVFILAVGLTGLTHGITTSLKSSKVSEIQSTASLLAAGRIEFIKADGFYLEGVDDGNFGELYPQFTWKSTITETDMEGLFEVRVEILDKDGAKPYFELTTLLFDPPYLSSSTTQMEDDESKSKNQRRGARP